VRRVLTLASVKLLTLVGLVMTTLIYISIITTLEVAATESQSWFMHPTWMPRDVGTTLGDTEVRYVVKGVLVFLVLVFWASLTVARHEVRKRYPREAY
jgi:hypothetical protein